MRLLHSTGERARILASDVEIADTMLSRAKGLMFRRSIPDDYALVFQFDEPRPRDVHMVFVPFPIDVLWLVGDEVVHKKRLRPWIGLGRGTADTLVELPAGEADDISEGDIVRLES
ncbi:DUF192 domain-containing protein [Haloarchaeobius sp. TZWSO28]|uniref:DUF192 domain-containing protein n=1 Tax=Haloarchaeobius sp. TZWSO28 TaxID=3446119 RepID=UPI003EB70DC1